MRGLVKLFFFLAFSLAVFAGEYYFYMQHQPANQVQLALRQFDNNHQTATEIRTGLWFWSLDSVHLAVVGAVVLFGVVMFWDELVAVVKWLALPKPELEGGDVQ